MYINEQELESRLNGQVQIKEKRSYIKGGNLPDELRLLAGALTHAGDRQVDVAEALGMSQHAVSSSARGLIDNKFDKELADKVSRVSEDRNKAIKERAMDALANMVEQVANTTAGLAPDKASKIALDMARVSSSLSGGIEGLSMNGKALIIIAPAKNDESHYKTIDVKGVVD